MVFDSTIPYNSLPPIPPKTEIETTEILRRVVAAGRSRAELKGLGATIPNQSILVNSVVLQEAKASSEIENIITTNDALFRAVTASSTNVDPATKEVLRYREALWEGFKVLKKHGLLTTNLFVNLVRIIKQNQAGISVLPGTVIQNTSTGAILCTPPTGGPIIRDKLKNLEVYCSFWALNLHHEFAYSIDEGTTEESGATRRMGVDMDIRAQFSDWLWVDLDLTISRGHLKNLPDGDNFAPLAPPFTSAGGFTARHPNGREGTMRYRHIGDLPANEQNTMRAKGSTIFDVRVAYHLQACRLSLMAENVFNTLWNEPQFATESRLQGESQPASKPHFTPGTPLSVRGKVEIGF